MLKELNKKQKELLSVYEQNSMNIGLQTGPTNRPVATDLVNKFYKDSGFDEPHIILFAKSPKEATIIASIISEDPNILQNYEDNNDDFIQFLLSKFNKKTSLKQQSITVSGNHETYWLQFYEYFRKECGIKFDKDIDKKLTNLIEYSKNAGWLYTYKMYAIVVDRPEEVHLEDGLIHNENGPAIRYSDGFAIYAVNGHIVPEWLIEEKEKITLDLIKNEHNTETKRIMIDFYGPTKYILELGGEVLDSDKLNLEGSATRALIKDKNGDRWLIGSDGSTGRVYSMPISGDVYTCAEAHEEISGFSEKNCIFES